MFFFQKDAFLFKEMSSSFFACFFRFSTLCYATLTIVAYFVRDWRKLQYVLSLCSIPVIFCCMLIPESIRFLVVKFRLSDAHRVINAYAAYNQVEKQQEEDLGTFSPDAERLLGLEVEGDYFQTVLQTIQTSPPDIVQEVHETVERPPVQMVISASCT